MFNINTPTHLITTQFILDSGVRVSMKRDDLIHPFISGNKWRKLKYNVIAFQNQTKNKLVTFGGAYSNHLVATAAVCAANKIPCVGVVRGEELKGDSNFVLRLCMEYGMKLEFISREHYKQKKNLYAEFEDDYFVIPEGGDNILGQLGCQEIVESYSTYNHIILAVGTGTTFSGIVEGSEGESTIHGIPAMNESHYLSEIIQNQTSYNNWILHSEYSHGGFGKFDAEQLGFNASFTKQTGILLDPVYTGKMMQGLYNLIESGTIKSNESVLAIHTGGLTGMVSDKWIQQQPFI
jgi:1-aminocyclopropane-1-carboxylate deaminase